MPAIPSPRRHITAFGTAPAVVDSAGAALPVGRCETDDGGDQADATDQTEDQVVADAVGLQQTDEADDDTGDARRR